MCEQLFAHWDPVRDRIVGNRFWGKRVTRAVLPLELGLTTGIRQPCL
jgi:hypothetical protein